MGISRSYDHSRADHYQGKQIASLSHDEIGKFGPVTTKHEPRLDHVARHGRLLGTTRSWIIDVNTSCHPREMVKSTVTRRRSTHCRDSVVESGSTRNVLEINVTSSTLVKASS